LEEILMGRLKLAKSDPQQEETSEAFSVLGGSGTGFVESYV
jgi:hypothetical protein